MVTTSSVLSLAAVLSAAAPALAAHGGPYYGPKVNNHHRDVANNKHVEERSSTHNLERSSTNSNVTSLAERGYSYTGIRATWYGSGLSACGPTYGKDDFIVALSQETFGWDYPSKYCNREIVISYGGKTANAKIVDSCVGCSDYSPWALDFTEGLFSYFADLGEGVLAVDWSFADGSGGGSAPATTSKKPAAPTTTSTKEWVAPTTSTKEWVAPTTSTTKWVEKTTSSTEWIDPTTILKWVETTSTKDHTTTTTHTTPTTTSVHTTSTTSTTSSAAVTTTGLPGRCANRNALRKRKAFMRKARPQV